MSKEFYVSNVQLYKDYLRWYEDIEEAEKLGKPKPPLRPYIVEAIQRISRKLSHKPRFIQYTYREDMISDAILECILKAEKFNPNKLMKKITLSSRAFDKGDTIYGETSGSFAKVKFVSTKNTTITLDCPEDMNFVVGETVFCDDKTATIISIDDHKANNPFAYLTTIVKNSYLHTMESEKNQVYIRCKLVEEIPYEALIEISDHDASSNFTNGKSGLIDFYRENSDILASNLPKNERIKRDRRLLQEEADDLEG